MAGTLGRALLLLTVLGLPGLFWGCAGRGPAPGGPAPGRDYRDPMKLKPYQVNGTWYYPLPTAAGYQERGLASWYGSDFHGQPTANGEIYDMNAMTAAHKTLPIGTVVRVTHLETLRAVEVRINDRGPFVDGRLIDLSREAAKQLGLIGQGVARVEVRTVRLAPEEQTLTAGRAAPAAAPQPPPPAPRTAAPAGLFTVQVGSFQLADQAMALKSTLGNRYPAVRVRSFALAGVPYYRVQIGRYSSYDQARLELARIKQTGFPDAFVTALEED